MNVNGKSLCTGCFEEKNDELEVCDVCGYYEGKEQASTSLSVGTLLLGRYTIGKVLGKGGFGVTYLAYDLKRECKVAIKEYMPDSLSYRTPGVSTLSTYEGDKEESFKIGAEKFYEEAKTVSKFNGHPNIINVYEFFYENNTAYFVMEYIKGVDLKTYLSQKGGTICEEECIRLLTPIMDALIVIHSIGILHRDISPDNIYITKDQNVKLLDFGAARQVLGEKSKSLSVVLKPGFAPIEQYQTRGKQGQWTDVYALAATMYFCLTGQVPEAAMDRIEEDNIRAITEFNSDISTNSVNILTKALSVKAIDRYQTMSEFKQAFNIESSIVDSNIEEIKDDVKGEIATKPFKIKKILIPALTTGIIIVCFIAGYRIWKNSHNEMQVNGSAGSAQVNYQVSQSNNAKETASDVTATKNKNIESESIVDEITADSSTTSSDINQGGSTATVSAASTDKATSAATKETQVTEDSEEKAPAMVSIEPIPTQTPTPKINSTPTQEPIPTRTPVPTPTPTVKVEGKDYTYVTKKFSVACTYTGEWKDGKPNGFGELKMIENDPPYWESGDRLSGSFTDGLLNGEGKYTGASGGSYKGNFKNGLKNGYGEFKFSDGSSYKGYFKEGDFHGDGIFRGSDGTTWEGKWANGEFLEYSDIDL